MKFLGYLKPLSGSPFNTTHITMMGYVQVASLASSLVSVSLCSFVFFCDVVTYLAIESPIPISFSVTCDWKCVISAVSSLTLCIYIGEISDRYCRCYFVFMTVFLYMNIWQTNCLNRKEINLKGPRSVFQDS